MNDQIMLSDEILDLIAPGHGPHVQVKFDDVGTLHIFDRDEDGKLIKDYPVVDLSVLDDGTELPTQMDDIKALQKINKKLDTTWKSIILAMILMTVLCVITTLNGVPTIWKIISFIVMTFYMVWAFARWLRGVK